MTNYFEKTKYKHPEKGFVPIGDDLNEYIEKYITDNISVTINTETLFVSKKLTVEVKLNNKTVAKDVVAL